MRPRSSSTSPRRRSRTSSRRCASAGGAAIGAYREPLSGKALLLAALPIAAVEPTPFQRDLSPTHTKRLAAEDRGERLVPRSADRRARRRRPAVDAQRPPPPGGREGARAQADHGADLAGRGAGVPDPRAQHREGAQPQGPQPRGDPHGARAGAAREDGEGGRLRRRVRGGRRCSRSGSATSRTRVSPAAPTIRSCARSTASAARRCRLSLREREGYAARLLEIDADVKRIVGELQKRGFKSPYLRTLRRRAHQPGALPPRQERRHRAADAAAGRADAHGRGGAQVRRRLGARARPRAGRGGVRSERRGEALERGGVLAALGRAARDGGGTHSLPAFDAAAPFVVQEAA